MQVLHTDITIAGGGIAGLTATAALAAEGFSVACVDPALPKDDHDKVDLRSTAFLEPSIEVLRRAGLWARLAPFATDLVTMRVADAGGAEAAIRESVDFNAAEIGQARFGCNLPNQVLRREITAHLRGAPGVTLIDGSVESLLARSREAILRLSDGRQLRCPLVLAADGRDSALRSGAGIGVRTTRYGQKALVFAVSHALPHDNVSTEIHRSGGPFTLVPLPENDGLPHSAVVWMERGPEAVRLASLPEADFTAALNARGCGVLGPLAVASPVALWPIISQIAHRLTAPRLALIAEAAHVVPPIGAQGLNMSLGDIALLRDLVVEARDAGRDIGAPEVLAAYGRRHLEVAARVAGIDALNRASMAGAQSLRDLRRAGLRLLGATSGLKQGAMRLGLGG